MAWNRPIDWHPAMNLPWVCRVAWRFVSIDRQHRSRETVDVQRWPVQQKCIRPTTYQCWLCTIWHQRVRRADDTTVSPLRPSSTSPECQMHGPNRNRPASVRRFYWWANSVASDHDGAHCDCDRRPVHATADTWNSSPHPNRCHRSNCRNTFSNLGRNARRLASISYPNEVHHTSGRYSYVSVPANRVAKFMLELRFHTLRLTTNVLSVSKSLWGPTMERLPHLRPDGRVSTQRFPMYRDSSPWTPYHKYLSETKWFFN